MNPPTKKRRAIITGASSGIGRAVALAFAQADISTALVSRSREKLTEVATQVKEQGAEAQVYPFDLAQVREVKDKLKYVADDFGPIDILVNNAGMGYTGSLEQTSLSDWQRVIDLNLTSVFQCIMGVLPGMRMQKKGIIVNVASIAAHKSFPGWGAYSASKAGLVSLSKTLAEEERANGIRITIISPGAVNSSLWDTDTVQADFNRSAMLTPKVVAQSILQTVLLPEAAVVEEMTIMPSAGAL